MHLSPRPSFEHVAASATTLRAWGRHAALAIESPLPGVLRVRVAPRAAQTVGTYPELAPKPSFARVATDRPLEALRIERTTREAGDVVAIHAPEATLALSLADGGWLFSQADGRPLARALGVEGHARPDFPVDHRSSRLTLVAPEGEAYLGFGEKVGPLDKRGMRFTFWNTDAFPPEPHTDPLYASIPFFIALRGGVAWGLFVDETTRAHVDVAKDDPDRIAWQVEGPEIDAYLLTGPTPADVLRRYVALTGRPFVPPLFALGAQQSRWGYASAAEVVEAVGALRERGFPLDVVMLDIDHMDAFKVFTWDRARFPAPRELARDLASHGVRMVPIVDPGLKVDDAYPPYVEARDRGYLVEVERGGPLVGAVWPDPAVFPDLTRTEVQTFWGDLHRSIVEAGGAGVWNDMNEPSCFSVAETPGLPSPLGKPTPGASTPVGSTLPDEARHGERRHLEVHNAYGLGMARAAYEGLARHAPSRRPFVLTRAAYAGIQRFAALWTGDFGSHWSHFEASLPMLLGLGLSGVPFVGADVPGFVADASGELLVRWTQAAIFAPLFRNHSARGTHRQEPWRFGEPWSSIARRAYELRYRLLPSLYTAMIEASQTGIPPLQPLVLAYPGDREALVANDQMLFAGALLAAPVVRPGHTKRLVYLPPGTWVPLTFDFVASAALRGARHVVADAPLDRVPLFLRDGAGLALTAPALHTTSAEWGTIAWHLNAAAEGPLATTLYEDAGDGPALEAPRGVWTRITGERTARTLHLARAATADARTRLRESLHLHGVPEPARVDGAEAFAHDGATLIIDVTPGWTAVDVRF